MFGDGLRREDGPTCFRGCQLSSTRVAYDGVGVDDQRCGWCLNDV